MKSDKVKIVDAKGFHVYAVEIVEGVKSLYMPQSKKNPQGMLKITLHVRNTSIRKCLQVGFFV